MRRYRLQKIDPLDVSLTCGLISLVVLGIFGIFTALGKGIEGHGWSSVLELPLLIGLYSIGSTISGFVVAIAFNIVSYYTGGVTLTFRECSLARPGNVDDDRNDGPPNIGPPAEPRAD